MSTRQGDRHGGGASARGPASGMGTPDGGACLCSTGRHRRRSALLQQFPFSRAACGQNRLPPCGDNACGPRAALGGGSPDGGACVCPTGRRREWSVRLVEIFFCSSRVGRRASTSWYQGPSHPASVAAPPTTPTTFPDAVARICGPWRLVSHMPQPTGVHVVGLPRSLRGHVLSPRMDIVRTSVGLRRH